MSQTFQPARCLGKELQKGDSFPGRRRPSFPFLSFLRRIKCCVRRFDVPLNTSTDPAAKRETFDIEAEFQEQPGRCRCDCCEYRQYVRGTFTDAGGANVRFGMPSGALQAKRFCEDGSIDEFSPGGNGLYGHRGSSTPGDAYGGPGCEYRGNEAVSCPPGDSVQVEFLGVLVDTCQGRVVATKKWTVGGRAVQRGEPERALGRRTPEAGARATLPGGVVMFALGVVPDEESAATVGSYLEAVERAVLPYRTGDYPNFVEAETDTSSFFDAETWARLREVKALHDPSDLFRGNHHIPPAE